MTFIERASELEICYVSTGFIKDIKFDICNVDVTETELVLSDLDYCEIRLPLDNLPILYKDDSTIMEVWQNDSIRFEF